MTWRLICLFVVSVSGAGATQVSAQETCLSDLARTVVERAKISTGEKVEIRGRPGSQSLMEEILLLARRRNASCLLSATSDRLINRLAREVPIEVLSDPQGQEITLQLTKMFDVAIVINALFDDGPYVDLEPERRAILNRNATTLEAARLERGTRLVYVGNKLVPTAQQAKVYDITLEELEGIFCAAVNMDPQRIRELGSRVGGRLQPGVSVRVTHPNGTNLNLTIGEREPVADCGIIPEGASPLERVITLPAGEVNILPATGSVQGTLVLPVSDEKECQGGSVSLIVRDGKILGIPQPSSCGVSKLSRRFDAGSPGHDEVSVFGIGINEGVPSSPKLNSRISSGAFTVYLGANVWAGGNNRSTFRERVTLLGCTITVNDKEVVVDKGHIAP